MLSAESNRLICGVSPAARSLIAVLVLAPTTGCWLGDSTLGPDERVAQLTLVTAFSTQGLGPPAAVSPLSAVESLGFIVRRMDGSIVVADTVPVGVENGRVEYDVEVTYTPPAETFSVEVVLLNSDGIEVFRGEAEYTISAAEPSPLEVTVAPSQDVGPIVAQAIASMEDAMFIGLNGSDELSDLDNFSFAESNSLFLDAVALSPTDATALFGAAVTGIFVLEDNSRLRTLADDLEAWAEDDSNASPVAMLLGPAVTAIGDPITLPLGFSTGTVEQVAHSGMAAVELLGGPILTHGTPPSVVEAQAVLEDVVRPALIQALEYLLAITDSDFTFTVTERMQGEDPIDADPLELDYTEVLTMQAGLEAALAAVDVATAYVLTPNPLGAQGFVNAMTPGSSFLTLAPEGAANLADALVRLQSTGNLLLAAIDELEAETDDQTDDIIKIDLSGFGGELEISPEDLADAKTIIQDILDALSGPTVVTLAEGEVDEISFTADARQFFTNPIQDLKAMLAPYEVFTAQEVGETVEVFRWLALNVDEWTFPDPSFNGILPEMSTMSDLLNTFPEFGQFFFDFSLTEGYYRLTTMTDTLGQVFDCEAIRQASLGLDGCQWTGTTLIYSADISLGGSDDEPDAFVSFDFSFGFRFFAGSYVVVDNLDGTYTVTMDLLRQDDGSNTPSTRTRTFRDNPGFTSIDEFGRSRGGSSLSFITASGREFLFEKQ